MSLNFLSLLNCVSRVCDVSFAVGSSVGMLQQYIDIYSTIYLYTTNVYIYLKQQSSSLDEKLDANLIN